MTWPTDDLDSTSLQSPDQRPSRLVFLRLFNRVKQLIASRGSPLGVASLDLNRKVPSEQIPYATRDEAGGLRVATDAEIMARTDENAVVTAAHIPLFMMKPSHVSKAANARIVKGSDTDVNKDETTIEFLTSGTLTVRGGPVELGYAVIAGGGGGGTTRLSGGGGGGGGGGGLLTGVQTFTPGTYTIFVGAGGSEEQNGSASAISDSAFSIEASGGGAGGSPSGNANKGGLGAAGQGHKGGDIASTNDNGRAPSGGSGGGGATPGGSAAGGGGAGEAGNSPTEYRNGGQGGRGLSVITVIGDQTASALIPAYAAGGGGGGGHGIGSGGRERGSSGRGGTGWGSANDGFDADENTGSGGGGGGGLINPADMATGGNGGNGGSGIVIFYTSNHASIDLESS